jgi:hypothetical protein
MKYVILLLFTLSCFAQEPNTEERNILRLELARQAPGLINKGRKEIVGDSIPVSKTVLPYGNRKPVELKSWCMHTYLTTAEATEIFGDFPEKQYDSIAAPTEWQKSDFGAHKVFLFDPNKHMEGSYRAHDKEKRDQRILIGTSVISISYPLIRQDNKFALVITDDHDDGGSLSIYKNMGNTWQLHKLIQLYYY